ncbi:MAG: cache domain-containing protein [Planctomycetota bacterium]|nr:cache domain-containing protein [Planctomycetota bacterium]
MSLKGRIVISMLSVVAISGGVSTFIGAHLLWQSLGQEARTHVRQSLNAAREFYRYRLDAMAGALQYTALGERFSQGVADRDVKYLATRLEAVRKSASLDILYVTDADGRVIFPARRPGVSADKTADDPLVASVLANSKPATGTLLVPVGVLAKQSEALAEQARIQILPTPKATPSTSTETDAGMMLAAAAPVLDGAGRVVGVLRAGILLNRNFDLVDQVQNTVFRGERYGGKPLGTATIFQNDVRISTNVLQEDGSRAVGTRASADVCRQVLERQEEWLGNAWVVNDWYLSAYAPIDDVHGTPIGMLYVGVLERKFGDVTMRTMETCALVTVAGLLAAGLIAWKLAASISQPVRSLATASQAVARGDFSGTVPADSGDEIGALGRAFNAMACSLRERDELLKQRTRMQLTRSERMAAIGRLAAGVAHEINNPLTGVLTFAHVLLKDAPPKSRQQEDLQTILDATVRCRDIIRGLLNFSRQSEPQKRLSDLNQVLREALNLTRNQAHLHRIAVTEELAPDLPQPFIDPYQVQEVAVNVIINAIDAMPEGGTLTVRSRPADAGRPGVEFQIADTGTGIPPENIDKIFDPFFTTKQPGKGTGLGLAISYGIVTEHGGEISVASEVGRGTTLTVYLPLTAQGKDA